MKVKELQKTVNIAWSPQPQNPIYLAAGTAAQQFDSNVTSNLEIYATNFSDPSYDLKLKASLPSQFRFQKIIWSPTGMDGAHSNGLIVGGCEGGHVMIYSASKMLSNEEGLLARQDKHTGPVSGLDFNTFQTNLLATCASESEIFIWDLNNTTTHMNPGAKTQPFEDVQNVAWNKQVQHILASVFSSRCVIWDLRKSEQIIKLSDTQSRVRWHGIQWHPDVATQVWLASEDDQAPVVQLWDLRYATAPAKTMQIHQRGILGMSWCPHDIDLMVSCGKDNRIYCWNPNTEIPEGEILSEVATTATWYSDVKFCPRNPALIASSSLDGNVSVYSLFGGTQQQVETANKIADSFPGMDQFAHAPLPQQSTQIVYHDLKRAPKWIKRPAGVAFGFGGKLVTFNGTSKTVNVSQVITEPELVERANALEHSLNEANFIEYCRQRADQMPDQNGRYLWYFIKANFEMNPKEEMLNLLGYSQEDVHNKFSKYIKEEEEHSQNDIDQLTNRISHLNHSDSSEVECDHSTNDSIDLQNVDNNAVFDDIAAAQKQQAIDEKPKPDFQIPSGDHPDSLVTEALLTGNLEAAVELCFDSDRTTEALIIASTAGIDFLTRMQNRYLKKSKTELSNIIAALVSRDWLDFVNRCTVGSWKEALVAALKHSERKAVDICERLGDRLLNESANNIDYIRNAMLCYICAGSIDKIVTAWYKIKQLEQQNPNYKLNTVELQELAEVVMLMSKSLEQQGISLELNDRFADFIAEYGGLLVSQGALTAALAYIFALGNSEHPEVNALRERIYNTVNYKKEPATMQPATRGFEKPQQQQNSFSRQLSNTTAQFQQQRGSFSQTQPLLYPGNVQSQSTQQQQLPYQTSTWNATAAQTQPTLPTPGMPALYNPTQPTAPLMPAQNDVLSQPPRPASNASSQGGGVLHARSKYVLDPSVAPTGGPTGYGNIAAYNAPAPAPIPAPNAFNTTPFNANAMGGGSSMMQPQPPQTQQPTASAGNYMQPTPVPNYNATPFANANPYGAPTMEPQQPVPQAPFQNMQRNPTPPPGWNDPPALSSRKLIYYPNNKIEMSAVHAGTRKWHKIINHLKDEDDQISLNPTTLSDLNFSTNAFQESIYHQSKKSEQTTAAAPITHPIFGVDPNQNQNHNQNGYMDPNQYQQQQQQQYSQMTGMPAPPPPLPSQSSGMHGMPTPIGGSYLNPTMLSNNNQPPTSAPPQLPQQMNFQTSAIQKAQQQQQQQQPWNPQSQTIGYTENAAPIQRQPELPKEKPPLPEEYVYMQTVFEELKTLCLNAAADPRTKRKFVDVTKRLENLYDCLRDGRLAAATIAALNQIVQYMQVGDYANALQTHTQIAFGTDFSQCAGFMPGLKVLLQSATELQVYLR